MSHGVAISLPSLVPERLDFASRNFATNGIVYFMQSGDAVRVASGSRDFIAMSTWDRSTGHNVDAVHQAFAMLVCARVFVLKRFLEKIRPGTSAETARRRWVLIQVMPPFDSIEEIFASVLGVLRGAHKTDMGLHRI